MEHVVQFGINVDDDAIKKAIEKNVMMQVAGQIKGDVMKSITGKKECNNYEYTTRLKQIVEETTSEFLETNRDDIIEATACKLTERLIKTKVVKDMVNNTINSLLE